MGGNECKERAIQSNGSLLRPIRKKDNPIGRPQQTLTIPSGLENTQDHEKAMLEMGSKQAKIVRKDGDPENAFRKAAKIIEQTYTAPFLAHNCMEPMNFFADVQENSAELAGPLQKAELTERALHLGWAFR